MRLPRDWWREAIWVGAVTSLLLSVGAFAILDKRSDDAVTAAYAALWSCFWLCVAAIFRRWE